MRAWDNTGAVLPGVAVTIVLQNAPGATLSGNVAVTDAQGVATFPALTVDTVVTGAVLRATATSPGVGRRWRLRAVQHGRGLASRRSRHGDTTMPVSPAHRRSPTRSAETPARGA